MLILPGWTARPTQAGSRVVSGVLSHGRNTRHAHATARTPASAGIRAGRVNSPLPSFRRDATMTASVNMRRSVRLSPAGRALGVHVARVERMACRHEEAVAIASAETDIGGALGQRDRADPLAFRIEDRH